MKSNNIRIGVVAMSKINGKYYKITNVSIKDNMKIGTAIELLDEDTFGKEHISITDKNVLAFYLVDDPEPYPEPEGYNVVGGKLMKDGKSVCEQGSVVVKNILATQPDYLFLVCNSTTNDFVDIMSYQVSRDRFAKFATLVKSATFKCVEAANGDMIMAYQCISESEEEESGEKKIVRHFTEAGIFTIRAGKVFKKTPFGCPITMDAIKIVNTENVEYSNNEYAIFVPSDEDIDDTDCESIVEKRNMRMWFILWGKGASFRMNGDICASWSYIAHDWVIKNDMELLVLEKQFHVTGPEIAKLQGYDYLIDIIKGEHQYTLTFSNDNYEFKTLVSKSTKDRGYIVTVE